MPNLRRPPRLLASLLLVALIASACASDDPSTAADDQVIAAATTVATATTAPPATPAPTTSPPTTPAPTTSPPTTPAPTTTLAPVRTVMSRAGQVFGMAGPVTLVMPADGVELIGFHESSHDGSQQIEIVDQTIASETMETRERGTGSRTAADIAVDPDGEIRSPVTGTVLRSGGYTLYCDYQDDFAVIEPDERPGWEVKIFHIDGVQVFAGDRVEAGQTVIAPRPTRLQFESQIDELTFAPAWPHVHVEVIDPSIPDRPTGPGCP